MGVAWYASVFATVLSSEKVKLGLRDQAQLQVRICGSGQKADQVDAQRVRVVPLTITARITCAPFGVVAGYPALKIGYCAKIVEWSCDPLVPALRMKFLADDLVLEYAKSVTSSDAIEIARFVSSASGFNGQDVRGLLVGRCRIGNGSKALFPGAVNFAYSCDGPSASITKDCWKGPCRFFFTDFDVLVP
jgi:hypothetical protein